MSVLGIYCESMSRFDLIPFNKCWPISFLNVVWHSDVPLLWDLRNAVLAESVLVTLEISLELVKSLEVALELMESVEIVLEPLWQLLLKIILLQAILVLIFFTPLILFPLLFAKRFRLVYVQLTALADFKAFFSFRVGRTI